MCGEHGKNHMPQVGTDVDTPGGCNWGNSLLVALIFFENLARHLSAESGSGDLTGALEEKVPREAVMGSDGKWMGRTSKQGQWGDRTSCA